MQEELGLTGTEEETNAIARMQVIRCALLDGSFSAISRAHFLRFFYCSRCLRVSTALPRRFQQAPSRKEWLRNSGTSAKSGGLHPSFDTSDA